MSEDTTTAPKPPLTTKQLTKKLRKLRKEMMSLATMVGHQGAQLDEVQDSLEEARTILFKMTNKRGGDYESHEAALKAHDNTLLRILGRLDSLEHGTTPLSVDAPTVLGTVMSTLGDDITIRLADREDEDERYFVKGDVVNVTRLTTVVRQ